MLHVLHVLHVLQSFISRDFDYMVLKQLNKFVTFCSLKNRLFTLSNCPFGLIDLTRLSCEVGCNTCNTCNTFLRHVAHNDTNTCYNVTCVTRVTRVTELYFV